MRPISQSRYPFREIVRFREIVNPKPKSRKSRFREIVNPKPISRNRWNVIITFYIEILKYFYNMSIKKYLRIMHVFLITGMYWNLENAVTEPRAGAPFVGQNVGLLN